MNLYNQLLQRKKQNKNSFILKLLDPSDKIYNDCLTLIAQIEKRIIFVEKFEVFNQLKQTLNLERGLKKGLNETETALKYSTLKILFIAKNLENLDTRYLILESWMQRVPVFFVSSKENLAKLLSANLKRCTSGGIQTFNNRSQKFLKTLAEYTDLLYGQEVANNG